MLGGNFLSRINMDLRETKGWSYGVAEQLQLDPRTPSPYIVTAPVQADRTGEFDRRAERADHRLPRQQGRHRRGIGAPSSQQRQRAARPVRDLAGGAGGDDVATTCFGRPGQLSRTAGGRYRALNQRRRSTALRGAIDPKGFVWVVVGDAAKVKPQLDKLGMPIEVIAGEVSSD